MAAREGMRPLATVGRVKRSHRREFDGYIRRVSIGSFRLNGKRFRRLSLTIPGRGCSTDTCAMCPLPNFGKQDLNPDRLLAALSLELKRLHNQFEMLSIYVDGSYYAPSEVDPHLRKAIEVEVRKHQVAVYNVETLPSLFDPVELDRTRASTGAHLLVNVGVQSFNADIRKYCVGSPFAQTHVDRMLKVWRDSDVSLRVYLLFKPPFLSEREAMCDLQESVAFSLDQGFDIISVNPCKVAQGTLLEELFSRGYCRVPHLYSIAVTLAGSRFLERVHVELPGSGGCPGDVAVPHICPICAYPWLQGNAQLELDAAAPTCWLSHMQEEPKGDWEERVQAFWQSGGPREGRVTTHRHRAPSARYE